MLAEEEIKVCSLTFCFCYFDFVLSVCDLPFCFSFIFSIPYVVCYCVAAFVNDGLNSDAATTFLSSLFITTYVFDTTIISVVAVLVNVTFRAALLIFC